MSRVKEAVDALPSIDAFLDRKKSKSLKVYRRVAFAGYVAAMLVVALLAQLVVGSGPIDPTPSNMARFTLVMFVALLLALGCAYGAVVLYQMRLMRRGLDNGQGSAQ